MRRLEFVGNWTELCTAGWKKNIRFFTSVFILGAGNKQANTKRVTMAVLFEGRKEGKRSILRWGEKLACGVVYAPGLSFGTT